MPDFGGGGDGGSRLPITLALKVNTGVTPPVVTDVAYIYTGVTTVTARLCSWRLCSSNHDANYSALHNVLQCDFHRNLLGLVYSLHIGHCAIQCERPCRPTRNQRAVLDSAERAGFRKFN